MSKKKKLSHRSLLGQQGANTIERIVSDMGQVWRPTLVYERRGGKTMLERTRRRLVVAACAALALGAIELAKAQAYPARPVRLVVPYPPGGGTDTVARPLAQKLTESLGQPVLVDNRPGASEVIGTELVARAAPDGYTLLLTTNAFAINVALQPKLPYDSDRDFAPVSRLITTPFVLIANPQVRAATLPELIGLAKSQPGKLNYASLGSGTPHHLAMEWLKLLAGVDIVAVPYKGVGPGLAAVVSGEVQLMLTGLTAGLAQVKGGKVRALALTTAARSPAAPDVPTVAESGFPGYDALAWYGILAPAATPGEVIARLNAEIGKALATPDLRERFAKIGVDPAPSAPGDLQQVIRQEMQLWAKVIKATGTKPE
jgi:tripartite-type tricarboxylate transporter receptor subunit TctC